MPERDDYILAIDHGTSGIKAALVSVRGQIADFEFRATPLHHTPDGGAEQDPEDWWNAIVHSARALCDRNPVQAARVAAVCCSSTFSSTVAVDRSGRALMNSLTWLDSRGAACVRDKMRGLVNIQGYGISRVLAWIPLAGGAPALSGKDDMGHMLYIKESRPDIYKNADKFLGSKDYLNLRLTGKCAASYDSVSLFWVTDNRDINHIRYAPRLIRGLGIDAHKLPPLMASTHILGPILPAVARDLGVPRDTPVVVGSPDLQSACVGSGAVRDYQGHIYIGTSSWVLCHVPFKKTDVFHIIASLPSAVPGRYFCANEQDMAGGCMEFLLNNLLFDKQGVHGHGAPDDVYERVERAAARTPAGAHGVIFTPWLNGEKTPVEDHTLRGGFHNLSACATSDHLARAVMEGVAFNSRWVLCYVEKFIKRRMNSLNIIGGGARSDAWCQIYADVMDRTIHQVQDPLQANVRGAAFIAACALGRITFDDVPSLVPIQATFTPNPDHRKTYDRLFAEFLNLFKANRKIYRRLNRTR